MIGSEGLPVRVVGSPNPQAPFFYQRFTGRGLRNNPNRPHPVTGPAHRPDLPYSSTTSPGTTSGADTCPSVSTTVNAKS